MISQWAPLLGRPGVGEEEEVQRPGNESQTENTATATETQQNVKEKVQSPLPTFRQTTLLIDGVEESVDNMPWGDSIDEPPPDGYARAYFQNVNGMKLS